METWFLTDFAGAADRADFAPSNLADTPDDELLRSRLVMGPEPQP